MIRLAVRVRPEQAEIVLAELLEIASSGLEEVRAADGTIEFAIYGPSGDVKSSGDDPTYSVEAASRAAKGT